MKIALIGLGQCRLAHPEGIVGSRPCRDRHRTPPERIATLPGVTPLRGMRTLRPNWPTRFADMTLSSVRSSSPPSMPPDDRHRPRIGRKALSGRRWRGQPGGRARPAPDRPTQFPGGVQDGGERGRRISRPAARRRGLGMDLPLPLRHVRPRRADGQFRLGTDMLLSNEQGSSISFEDYAIALADEIEQPRHIRSALRSVIERLAQSGPDGWSRLPKKCQKPLGRSDMPG